MESINTEQVKSIWKTKGSKLKNPNIYFAVYMEKVYYVYRDDSFVIFMISFLKFHDLNIIILKLDI